MCGMPTHWAATRSSIRRSPSSIFAAASKPMPKGATASAACCRPAMPARRTDRRRSCSTQLGRHGNRPAHIHFFVTAPNYRKLTTQINIDGDAYLHDDFAFATRDGLIPEVRRSTDPVEIRARGLNAPFAQITFDFVLHREAASAPNTVVTRPHAEAA